MLGIGTAAIFQGIIVIVFGIIIGVPLTVTAIGLEFPVMIIVTIGLTYISLIIASLMTSLESFGTIVTFVNLTHVFYKWRIVPSYQSALRD